MSSEPQRGGGDGFERVALVSDVHGNVTAFAAVLADIRRRGVSTILNLGDVAGKGPRGSESVRLTQEHCAVTIRGNWDEFMPKPPDHDRPRHPAVEWWREELAAEQRDWLTSLPLSYDLLLSGRRVRLVHASAESVFVRVFPDHSDAEFAAMFAPTELTGPEPADVVCYGDIHYAYVRHAGGRSLVNVGSVGNSLDEPTASYVILSGVRDSDGPAPFGIEFVRVPYDIESEIAAAAAAGMPELEPYAEELRTARYMR